MPGNRVYDVIVMGGGPGGATLATLLSMAGVSVLVLERESFPRFHIGESLLPASLPILNRLGVEVSGRGFVYKRGAEFFDEVTDDYAPYPFDEALPGGSVPGHAYQVDRATFDAALLDRARMAGAAIHEGEAATGVEVEERCVRVRSTTTTHVGRYLVDATGQDALLARIRRSAEPIGEFGRSAVFTHFEGLTAGAMDAMGPDGYIKVLMRADGWSWLIPLGNHRLSVGTVTRNRGVSDATLDEVIAASPLSSHVTRGARRLGTRVVGNFSYRNTRAAGARYACIGDAACFLDPVFSSGVALAMLGAEALSEQLVPALAAGTEDAPDLFAPAEVRMDHAYAAMSLLIHAFYHTHFMRNLFFAERPRQDLRAGLISMLAGDVWRDDNPFQNTLFRSKRRQAWAQRMSKNSEGTTRV